MDRLAQGAIRFAAGDRSHHVDVRIPHELASVANAFNFMTNQILVDIDHFKNFNDTYSHQAGDMVLRTAAEIMKENMRDVDKVCRFGGEEFVIVLPECGPKSAYRTVERLRKAIARSKKFF